MSLTNELYSDRLGFLYILQNAFMPGIVKIGATRQHPLRRVKELSSPTGVPGEFTLAYYHSFSDSFVAEAMTHERFAAYRINDGREFFELHVDEAIAFVETLGGSVAYRERVEQSWNEALERDPVVGGTRRLPPKIVATPFADLFATFEDRGDGVLNAEEQAKCRALEMRTL